MALAIRGEAGPNVEPTTPFRLDRCNIKCCVLGWSTGRYHESRLAILGPLSGIKTQDEPK